MKNNAKLNERVMVNEHDELFVQLTLNALPLAVCVLDRTGTVLSANPLCRELAKSGPVSEDDVLGRNYVEVMANACCGNPELSALIADVKAVIDGQRENAAREFECRSMDRPTRFLVRAVRVPDDGAGRIMVSHLDVTQRHEAQTRVRELTENLELTVSRRTAELQRLVGNLEFFRHAVAHDLRAPVRAIEGFSQILLESNTDELVRGAHECARHIAKCTGNLSAMLNGLMEISVIAHEAPAALPVNISVIACELAQEIRQQKAMPNTRIAVSEMPEATGDAALIRLILQNLMDNACKYSSRSKLPLVEVGARNDADGTVVYFVRDNGIGFAPQAASRLFNAFQRMPEARDYAGAGIGLTTVKRIVELHGGRVWAEGESGKGATFYFTLGKATSPNRVSACDTAV